MFDIHVNPFPMNCPDCGAKRWQAVEADLSLDDREYLAEAASMFGGHPEMWVCPKCDVVSFVVVGVGVL